ncbi:MAG: hypothetical protein ABIH23_32325 [bacterium]
MVSLFCNPRVKIGCQDSWHDQTSASIVNPRRNNTSRILVRGSKKTENLQNAQVESSDDRCLLE